MNVCREIAMVVEMLHPRINLLFVSQRNPLRSLPALASASAGSAQVTESCAGVASNLAGVATLDTGRTQFILVAATTDESRAMVLSFARQ